MSMTYEEAILTLKDIIRAHERMKTMKTVLKEGFIDEKIEALKLAVEALELGGEMIKAKHLKTECVDCQMAGDMRDLNIEYNAVVVGMIKSLRQQDEITDEDIEKILVEHIATAFKILDYPGGITEV